MKKVLANVTKIVFSIFGLAILGLLMSLTYEALGRIFPNNFQDQLGVLSCSISPLCAGRFASRSTVKPSPNTPWQPLDF